MLSKSLFVLAHPCSQHSPEMNWRECCSGYEQTRFKHWIDRPESFCLRFRSWLVILTQFNHPNVYTTIRLEPDPQGSPDVEAASKGNSKQQTTIGTCLVTARMTGFLLCLRMFGLLFGGVLGAGR